MRLATIATPKGPRVVAQVDESYVDLHATDPGLPRCIKQLLVASPAVRKAAADAAKSPKVVYAAHAVKLLPPVPNPGKILCIGLNYRDHAIEGGKAIPAEPVLFAKFPNTLIAHGDPIQLPKVAQKAPSAKRNLIGQSPEWPVVRKVPIFKRSPQPVRQLARRVPRGWLAPSWST